MELVNRIDEDLKSAMKDKDTMKVSVLRLLKSALNYKQIDSAKQNEGARNKLSDVEVVGVIEREVKKRQESVEAYRGRRDDLADKEQREMEILKSYLPEGLSDDEIVLVIEEFTKGQNFGMQEFGRLMGMVMGSLKKKGQRVDGGQVKRLVEMKLRN